MESNFESNFERLVAALNIFPLSTNILHQITLLLEQRNDKPFHSLLILQKWAWQLLSQDSHQWINQPYYQQLFHTLASFNKDLIFNDNDIETDTKKILLFSVTIDQIDSIFKKIESSDDDNDPYIILVSLWFDNHSHFIHDNPHRNVLTITDHISQYIIHNYVMSEQFKFYLTQIQQSPLAASIFTAKMLFYIKTCSFSLYSYIGVRAHSFPYTADEMLRYIGENYLRIVHVHSQTVASWNKDLLTCISHLISFAGACCWWDGQNRPQIKLLFPTEQIVCNNVQDLINIIAHRPFQQQIQAVRSNDETILMSGTLKILLLIVQTQNINWFFRTNSTIQNVLSSVAGISPFDEVCLCGYAILGEVLTDEQLKDLKIVETISGFFYKVLEHAWNQPSKKYKQISIEYLLRGKFIVRQSPNILRLLTNVSLLKKKQLYQERAYNDFLL
jgi:hypothetical protein